jgi:hypothetical protein
MTWHGVGLVFRYMRGKARTLPAALIELLVSMSVKSFHWRASKSTRSAVLLPRNRCSDLVSSQSRLNHHCVQYHYLRNAFLQLRSLSTCRLHHSQDIRIAYRPVSSRKKNNRALVSAREDTPQALGFREVMASPKMNDRMSSLILDRKRLRQWWPEILCRHSRMNNSILFESARAD